MSGVAYAERVAIDSALGVRRVRRAIAKAFETQRSGAGLSIVEVLSPCPTHWRMDSVQAWEYVSQSVRTVYPTGVLADRRGTVEWMSPVLSIVLTGRGGQGVKLSSELLAWSASADGYNPIQYSVYGALIRGGEIACSLAASGDDPGVPLRSDYALMCAMHNDWFDRYYPLLVPGGLLAYDVANIDAFVAHARRHRTPWRARSATWRRRPVMLGPATWSWPVSSPG